MDLFTQTEVYLLNWQEATHAHQYSAFILGTLKSIETNVEKLSIEKDDEEYMILTTSYIHKNISKCIDGKMIRRALQSLKSAGLIDYKTNNTKIFIKLNRDNIDELKKTYQNSSIKTKFIKLYHFSIVMAQEISSKFSILLALIISKFYDELSTGTFKSGMSVEYMMKKFGNVFSKKQLYYAEKLLKEAGIIEKSSVHIEEDGCWRTINTYKVNYEKIRAKSNEFNKANYVLQQTTEKTKYIKDVVTKDKNRGSYATRDGVKSGSYTKEEIAAFRAMAAAGEIETF